MNDTDPLIDRAFDEFDALNGNDPRSTVVDGEDVPYELAYGRRMSETLDRFDPHASVPLQLAARAQHITRWRIPREEYPEGKSGYKKWRSRLMLLHAEIADGVLVHVGYDEETRERVGQLLRKQGIKRDEDVQTLEDVACLVFMGHYFDEFAAKHDDDKLVPIVRKTLAKMSERGREAALGLDLSERAVRIVQRAMAEADGEDEDGGEE